MARLMTTFALAALQEALEISRDMRKGVWTDFKDFHPAFAEKVFRLLDEARFDTIQARW